MILNGCLNFGVLPQKLIPCNVVLNRRSEHSGSVRCFRPSLELRKSPLLAHDVNNIVSSRGRPCRSCVGSSNLSFRKQGSPGEFMIPLLDKRSMPRRSSVIVCASKSFFTAYPKMTDRPKWWWRSVACFPYLLPLHKLWMHADSVYHLHSLLEGWDFLVNPFIDTLVTMPSWLFMAILYCLYFFVVKKKECPHFLRFHVVMAMLLENVYEAMAIACTWLPKTIFRGDFGMHFWLAVTLAQLYTLVECMRCALVGEYADAPFVSDAAYLHTDPNLLPS